MNISRGARAKRYIGVYIVRCAITRNSKGICQMFETSYRVKILAACIQRNSILTREICCGYTLSVAENDDFSTGT
jgi:hypothetical protein